MPAYFMYNFVSVGILPWTCYNMVQTACVAFNQTNCSPTLFIKFKLGDGGGRMVESQLLCSDAELRSCRQPCLRRLYSSAISKSSSRSLKQQTKIDKLKVVGVLRGFWSIGRPDEFLCNLLIIF